MSGTSPNPSYEERVAFFHQWSEAEWLEHYRREGYAEQKAKDLARWAWACNAGSANNIDLTPFREAYPDEEPEWEDRKKYSVRDWELHFIATFNLGSAEARRWAAEAYNYYHPTTTGTGSTGTHSNTAASSTGPNPAAQGPAQNSAPITDATCPGQPCNHGHAQDPYANGGAAGANPAEGVIDRGDGH